MACGTVVDWDCDRASNVVGADSGLDAVCIFFFFLVSLSLSLCRLEYAAATGKSG